MKEREREEATSDREPPAHLLTGPERLVEIS